MLMSLFPFNREINSRKITFLYKFISQLKKNKDISVK